MKRIVCLGSSPAGVRAIESICEKQPVQATIISFDGFYPFNRQAFSRLIAKDADADDLYYRPKDFYERKGIKLVLDKKINRINFNRKTIFTEDKEQIEYDLLFICDFPNNKWPDIKGTNKNNVFSLNKLKGIHEIYDALPIFDSIVIQSSRLSGLSLALAFLEHRKDVTLITPQPHLLPALFTKEASDAFIAASAEKGLNIYTANEITEILGEGDAKAVRIKQNKVLASDVTILADVLPDPKIIADSPLATNAGILVDQNQQSSLADVYALDLAAQRKDEDLSLDKSLLQLESEGNALASHILGECISPNVPLEETVIETEGLSIIVLGSAQGSSGENKVFFDSANMVLKQLFIQDGQPTGAVLINARNKKELFSQALTGEADLSALDKEFIAAIEPTQEGCGELLQQTAIGEGDGAEAGSEQVAEGEQLRDN